MAEVQEFDQRAALVCLSCKAGKRQCDKLLPICSRCRKLNRKCEYQLMRTEDHVRPLEPETSVNTLSPRSCRRCRSHKRKCDRLVLGCSRCLKLGVKCDYEVANREPSPVLATMQETVNSMQPTDVNLFAATMPEIQFNPPIGYRPYMSMLLQFFLTSVALPSETVFTNSLAHHLRSTWIETAMSDPCLFHATMFSASVSTDMLRGRKNTMLTLYHQTCTIQLVNERLDQQNPVLNYGTLGAVIPLLFYNMVGLDKHSAMAHQRGLVKMLLLTPKDLRDNLGPLIAIVKVAMLSYACVFETPPIWDCLLSESVPPNAILRSLVTQMTLNRDGSVFEKSTIESILDVYEAVSRLEDLVSVDRDTIAAEVKRVLDMPKEHNFASPLARYSRFDSPGRLNACCQLSCSTFWQLLRGRSHRPPGTHIDNREETPQLLDHLKTIEPMFWVCNAPEAFTWIVFTGAAACTKEDDRGAFINYAGTVLTAVDSEKLTLLRQGWKYFSLLKRLGGFCEPCVVL